jgi:AraC-like DNA-binding protein
MIKDSDSLTDRLTGESERELTDPRNCLPARLTRGVPVTGGTTVYLVDPLGDVLDLSRVRAALLCNVHAAAPWGLDVPGTGGASVHVVTRGTAWLRIGGDKPARLVPGDMFLLPSGIGYRMSSTPDGPCERFDQRLKARMTPERDLAIGGGGASTVFLCAEYVYDLDVAQPLMSLLPTVLRVPADPERGGRVAPIVELLAGEVGAHGPGSQAAVARLLDLLLIEAIRHWIRRDPGAGGPSWLAALRDPAIARTIALLHARPAEPWTLERLAGEVHLSRATLARRFTEAVGEPPLAYLTRWRMHLAAARLKDTSDTVEVIAHEVGYTSEHAFNRAFARHRGYPPGRYRRLARTA